MSANPEYAARDAANAPYEAAFSGLVTVGLVKDGDQIVDRVFAQDRKLSFAGNSAYKMRTEQGLEAVNTYGLVPIWRNPQTKAPYIPDFAIDKLIEIISLQGEQAGAEAA